MTPAGYKNEYEAARTGTGAGQAPWRTLSPEDRNVYIEKYSPLIRYVADRLAARLPAHISKDDLISSGILGLIDAIDKFDPTRNIQFKTYAEFRVKGAMLDELRSMDWVPRSVRKKSTQVERTYQTLEAAMGRPATDEEVAEYLGLTTAEFHRLLDEVKTISVVDVDAIRTPLASQNQEAILNLLADESSQDALTTLGLVEARDIIAEAIGGLPEKESLVVSLYYYEELTMKEIGQVMGYTESRICQIHTKALLRLKARLRRYFQERGD